MPPSSPSDDTPAWIKGDLPLDVPEPGPEPAPAAAFEPKSGPETASQADPAGLSRQADEWVENEAGWGSEQAATAGETPSTDRPSGAQTGDRLEAVSAARRAELDSADNDADDVPGTPGDVEIDEAEAEADDDLDRHQSPATGNAEGSVV